MYKNLRQYLDELRKDGDLAVVDVAVDPVEEIAEIADRVVKSGGKALLFVNTGTQFPVAINIFGSEQRMASALGFDSLEQIAPMIERIASLAMSPKNSLREKLRALPEALRLASLMSRRIKGRGECQQIVLQGDDARLSLLPILKCWPHDGGKFITLPLVHTVDPQTGAPNVGMYRMQIFDEQTAGLHWHVHKTGERHYRAYKKRGERMPVAVALGGDPTYTYCATAPLPDGIDEYLLAGVLRSQKVKLVKCITNNIYVPSDCDFVIEGYVDTSEDKVVEGPFGDHTGFYSLDDLYPVMHVTAITHRRDAIYTATVVGVPPMEDAFIAHATEKLFLTPIKVAMQQEVRDLYMPDAGTAHNVALVRIDASYPAQGVKVASNLWGAGQMMFNKIMFVATGDVRDIDVVSRLMRGIDVQQDVMFSRGVLDVLDHATATIGQGGKMAIDATFARAEREIKIPPDFVFDAPVVSVDSSLVKMWSVLMICAESCERFDAERFLTTNSIEGVNFIVVIDDVAGCLTPEELLWWVSANVEVSRDVKVVGSTLIADARVKKQKVAPYPARYPNVVVSSRQIATTVDSRWAEYGLGEFVASPSEHYRALVLTDSEQI